MKIKSLPFYTFILLLCSIALPAQSVQKTLVRTFDSGGKMELLLDLNGPVTVQTWGSGLVRVQMQIALGNAHESTLQGLVSSGRYNLKGQADGEAFSISSPGLRKTVRIGDAVLNERVSFTVFAPENVAVTIIGAQAEGSVADGGMSRKPL